MDETYTTPVWGDTPDGWTLSHDLGQYDTGEVDTAEPPQPIMADDQALKAVRFWPAGTGETEDCLYIVT